MNLIERAKNIIVSPVKEWNVIAAETPDTGKIITGYVLPLAGAAALAAFIGYAFISSRYSFRNELGALPRNYRFGQCTSQRFCQLVCDRRTCPKFWFRKKYGQVGTTGCLFLHACLGRRPTCYFTGVGMDRSLAGLYGLYLLYVGMPVLKKTPADKHVGYFVVSLLVIIIVFFLIGWILGRLLLSVFGLSYGLPGEIRINY